MTKPSTRPYGSWASPITSDLIVAESISLSDPRLADDAFWLEQRPQEGGRLVIVRQSGDGEPSDLTPPGFNVRTRVHEYGGGAYAVSQGVVYFANFGDQRLYRQPLGGALDLSMPQPITPDVPDAALRYADLVVDEARQLIFCIREDHRAVVTKREDNSGEAVNTLVRLDASGDSAGCTVLASGNDFYSSPRLNHDGSKLAWLTWNHPNMPWDGTELWCATVTADGALLDAEKVAGDVDEAIAQPLWSPDGTLTFISDRSGWFNLYQWRAGESVAICPMDAEFAPPQWRFAPANYAFEGPDQILCAYSKRGVSHLARLQISTGTLAPIETPYTQISNLHYQDGRALFAAGSPTAPSALISMELTPDAAGGQFMDRSTGQPTVLRHSTELAIDAGYLSTPQEIAFPTEDNQTAYAFYYPPQNRDFAAPESERPPLLVLSHGGPTGATSATLNLKIQYWTSRGFAVVDVNYGGSSGYGRAYRQRLNGQWGIVDVDDCINAARYLADQGLVDGERLAIAGGSAGGYTTLCALTFHDVFRAGASHFGIGDLEVLAQHTHKFESRYMDGLIGPYPAEDGLYRRRSPIHFVGQLSCPLILFQGLEDKVVPPEQSRLMFEAVRAKGLPVAYLPFAGEQHGFRQAKNIKRALDAEFYFYGQVFGFALAEEVEPVEIENLS